MTDTLKAGDEVRDHLARRCAELGHDPVKITDCDDWPGKCVCSLVGTEALGCWRCRIILPDAARPK